MSRFIGIDLGSANTRIFCKGKGIVLNEPSVVAVEKRSGAVLAVGTEAKEMIGRTPEEVLVVRPVQGGVIVDFDVARAMLKAFIERACPGGFLRPYAMVCVSCGVTEVERRAILEAVVRSGGKNAYIIEEPMAAALGAGLSVGEAVGSMVVDIGGGTCEAAVVSFGGIVSGKSIRDGGDKMDEDIKEYIKEKYGLIIGVRTAEDIKKTIGSAHASCEEKEYCVMGRDAKSGLPKTQAISASFVREAMMPTIKKVISAVKSALEDTPPELAADIAEGGIVLTGGGAALPGLATLIEEETGIGAFAAENAEECVAAGAGIALGALFGKELQPGGRRRMFVQR